MGKSRQKPPPEAILHWIANRNRNIELADAISEYCKEYYKPDNGKERDENIIEMVRGWALEIVLNCDAELELMQKIGH